MFRLECCARAARRNPSVHIRIAESFCRSSGYGRIRIATRQGPFAPQPVPAPRSRTRRRAAGPLHARSVVDRRLGRRRTARSAARRRRQARRRPIVAALRRLLPAAAGCAAAAVCARWNARRSAGGRAEICLGRRRSLLPGRHDRRSCGRCAGLVAQRRVGHRGRKSAARRIWRGSPSVAGRPVGGADARGRTGPLPSPPGGVVREFTVSPHAPTLLEQPAIAPPARSNRRRCSQSFGLRATKISARRTSPHAHVRSEYGESGDRCD